MKLNIVDLHAEQIFCGNIHLEENRIARIERLSDTADPSLPYALPGFIDSHIHIESTLMTPSRFAPVALSHGTLAAVCDPHEIANVLGTEGIDFMIADGRQRPFHFHFMAPSCVPSTPFETAGAVLDAKAVAELLQRDDIGGLAEMMNAPGVLFHDPEVMTKIEACRALGKPIDGHAPGLGGDQALQYISAGISTDHECTTLEEASERIAMGMKVLIREGSAACDFERLSPLLKNHRDQLMFCTDDKYADELREGYIDSIVSRAVAKGLPIWNILRAACLTPVIHYGIRQGLLREGDMADFIVVDDLRSFHVRESWIEGRCVFGRTPLPKLGSYTEIPNRFSATPIDEESLRIAIPEGRHNMKVMVASEGSLLTGCEITEATEPLIRPDRDILKIVVLNRYAPQAKPAIAFIRGFGLRRGALASTIAHDSHNIIAIGCDDHSLAVAINHLIACQGGIAATDGKHTVSLALPIAGLMSDLDPESVAQGHLRVKAKAAELGCSFVAPFMTMAFMALPVIPELKLTDKGLFDGTRFAFTELFCD